MKTAVRGSVAEESTGGDLYFKFKRINSSGVELRSSIAVLTVLSCEVNDDIP